LGETVGWNRLCLARPGAGRQPFWPRRGGRHLAWVLTAATRSGLGDLDTFVDGSRFTSTAAGSSHRYVIRLLRVPDRRLFGSRGDLLLRRTQGSTLLETAPSHRFRLQP